MRNSEVANYANLLEKHLANEIDAVTFERLFLAMFKDQEVFLPADAFQILDGLFGDVDAFCADPALRGEDSLSEEQLRESCRQALERLRTLE